MQSCLIPPRHPVVRLDPARPWYVWVLESTGLISTALRGKRDKYPFRKVSFLPERVKEDTTEETQFQKIVTGRVYRRAFGALEFFCSLRADFCYPSIARVLRSDLSDSRD